MGTSLKKRGTVFFSCFFVLGGGGGLGELWGRIHLQIKNRAALLQNIEESVLGKKSSTQFFVFRFFSSTLSVDFSEKKHQHKKNNNCYFFGYIFFTFCDTSSSSSGMFESEFCFSILRFSITSLIKFELDICACDDTRFCDLPLLDFGIPFFQLESRWPQRIIFTTRYISDIKSLEVSPFFFKRPKKKKNKWFSKNSLFRLQTILVKFFIANKSLLVKKYTQGTHISQDWTIKTVFLDGRRESVCLAIEFQIFPFTTSSYNHGKTTRISVCMII